MTEERRNRKKKLLYRLLLVALLVTAAVSLWNIGKILYGYYEGSRQYDRLAELAEINEENLEHVNFKALREKNDDVKAWIYAEDTVINYPVVQGEDNQEYLYKTALGEWNSKGSIFIDYRCRKPFEDFNTILYGHRMKDGSMFHSLTKYENQDYFEKHPAMELVTPEEIFAVEIFGAVRIPADSPLYRRDFADRSAREEYLAQVEAESLIDTGVAVSAADRIVMLSTCTYEFEEARFVVYGRLKEKEG